MRTLIGVLIALAAAAATIFAGSLFRSKVRQEAAPARGLVGMDRAALRAMGDEELVVELDHLESTPGALRKEIDALCATLVDFLAGRDGLAAQDRLVEIGRPGLPRVLSSFPKAGDPNERIGMINACFVDQTLRDLTADRAPPQIQRLLPMANPSKEQIGRAIRDWYVWWYSEGYR